MAHLISTSISDYLLHSEFYKSYRESLAVGECRPVGWDTSFDRRTVLSIDFIDFVERRWFLWLPAVVVLASFIAFVISVF